MNASFERDLIEELDTDGFEKTVLFGYHGMRFGDNKHSQDNKRPRGEKPARPLIHKTGNSNVILCLSIMKNYGIIFERKIIIDA